MNMNKAYSWCDEHAREQVELLKEVAAIPSPSHNEDRRSVFLKNYLEKLGAKNVSIDAAKNVILPFGDCSKPAYVYAAHIDVVFPDTTPFEVKEAGSRLLAPGVGDDTANVVAMLMMVKYILSSGLKPKEPVLFVFNTCEEGLGNLKGSRQLFTDRKGLIREFVSFDGCYNSMVYRAVGSERWRVKVETCGGHSFSAFGNPNAIAYLAKLITKLDVQPVPKSEGTKTTYNFGTISGGTSVNAIAQNAEMLYEYRSDEVTYLSQMRSQFKAAVDECNCDKAKFILELVGERPCGENVDPDAEEKLLKKIGDAAFSVLGVIPGRRSASTDANIPLSLGVPAVTYGLYLGEGEHTREEYVEIPSLLIGLKVGMAIVLSHFV